MSATAEYSADVQRWLYELPMVLSERSDDRLDAIIAMRKLSAMQRSVIFLCYGQEMSIRAVARSLDVSYRRVHAERKLAETLLEELI